MRVHLEGQPLAILKMLLARPGELITREELLKELWPRDTFVDFEHSLNAAVKRLRAALNDSADHPRYIETLARRGYRLSAPVICSDGNSNLQVQPLPSQAQLLSGPALFPPEKRTVSRRLKIMLCVTAAVALLTIGLVLNRSGAKGITQPPITSLAVLPLKNLSGDPTQEYLADGMTESLIGRLASIHDLRVISRTSTMHFKDTQLSVPEISRTLHVDAIVEGSVMREGNRIRVHVQLIRGTTDEQFWSEVYDGELRDVFTLESQVAQSIAGKVEVTVTGKEQQRLTAARSVSPEVYESYLKGQSALDKSNSRTGIEQSIAYFQEAIKRDSSFAPAYLGMAHAYGGLSTIFIGAPPENVRLKAMSAVRTALELDPESVEGHLLLASTEQHQWQWAEAESEYRRALELNPNDGAAHAGLAFWLLCQGRTEEALAWAQRGRELDPLAVSGDNIGWILFQGHRFDQALHEFRSLVAVYPNDAGALWNLGFVLIAKDQPEEAIPVLEKAVSVSDRSPGVIGVLIRAYAHAGRRTDALRLLAELKRRRQAGYIPAAAFVNAYLGLGENDQAFVWFEQAYKEHSNILQFVKVHPYFDPIRGDPRFAELVRRIGLN
jgi:TolB-like protein/tetratricopeptide (TPR) repeat protein/DNA-binding winged helix-turn-helix (wHTH) protein